MPGLLADVNADKYLDAVIAVCRSAAWRDLWNDLDVRVVRFSTLALPANAPDSEIWHFCQREGLLLFTDNRNADREDSLQATIVANVTPTSLPVLTPGNSQQLLSDRGYAQRAAIRMMEILMDVDRFRGTGRLFLPDLP